MDDRVVSVGCPRSDRRCGGRRGGGGRPRGRRTPGLARRWLWRNAPQNPPGPVFAGWSYGWPSPRGGAARSASECTPRAPSGRRGVVGGRERGAGLRDVGRPLPEVPAKPPSVSRSWIRGTHVSGGRADGRVRLGHALSPGFQHVPPKCPPCLCPLRGRETARGASRQAGEGTSCQVRRGGKDRDTPRDSGRPAWRPKDGDTHGQTRDGRRLFPARATRPKHVPHSSIIPSARLSFPGFLITRRDRLFSGSCDHA